MAQYYYHTAVRRCCHSRFLPSTKTEQHWSWTLVLRHSKVPYWRTSTLVTNVQHSLLAGSALLRCIRSYRWNLTKLSSLYAVFNILVQFKQVSNLAILEEFYVTTKLYNNADLVGKYRSRYINYKNRQHSTLISFALLYVRGARAVKLFWHRTDICLWTDASLPLVLILLKGFDIASSTLPLFSKMISVVVHVAVASFGELRLVCHPH